VKTPDRIPDRVVAYLTYRRVVFHRTPALHPIRKRRIAAARLAAETYFREDPGRAALLAAAGRSISTGAERTDYHLLHRYVVTRRPRRVLEFGSGVTTLVMAHALAENHRNAGIVGHLYSLEAIPKFHENVKAILPGALRSYVTPICSPRREGTWRGEIWGFGYSELPPGPFDLVFVDGPTEYRDDEALRRGIKGVCLDLLDLLERDADVRLDVVVDQKFNSLEAYESVLPRGTVRYDPVMDVGVMAGLSSRLLTARRPPARNRYGNAWRMLGLT
jgi:predicted O-methyltransferase YrrM